MTPEEQAEAYRQIAVAGSAKRAFENAPTSADDMSTAGVASQAEHEGFPQQTFNSPQTPPGNFSGYLDALTKAQAQKRQVEQQAIAAQEQTAADMAAKRNQAIQDIRGMPMPPVAQPGALPPVPTRDQYIDKKAAGALFAVASAIAAIGAMGGRGRGMLAMSGLTGAIQGFNEGNMEKYKAGKEEYDRQLEAQKTAYQQARQQSLDILNNRNTTIEEKLLELQLQGLNAQDQNLINAAKVGSIDDTIKQIGNLAHMEAEITKAQKSTIHNPTALDQRMMLELRKAGIPTGNELVDKMTPAMARDLIDKKVTDPYASMYMPGFGPNATPNATPTAPNVSPGAAATPETAVAGAGAMPMSAAITDASGKPFPAGQEPQNTDPKNKHEEVLNGIRPELARQVRQAADGRLFGPVKGFGGKEWKQVQALANDYDHTYSPARAELQFNLIQKFGDSDKFQGKQKIRLNLAIPHLEQLWEAAKELDNTQILKLNDLINGTKRATGDPAVDKYKIPAAALASEVAGILKGTNAAPDKDQIQEQRDNLHLNGSPEQLKTIVQGTAHILQPRVSELNKEWEDAFGRLPTNTIINDQSLAALQTIGVDYRDFQKSAGGTGKPAAGVSTPRVSKDIDGKAIYQLPDGRWSYKKPQ